MLYSAKIRELYIMLYSAKIHELYIMLYSAKIRELYCYTALRYANFSVIQR